jgi:hypothetical protein
LVDFQVALLSRSGPSLPPVRKIEANPLRAAGFEDEDDDEDENEAPCEGGTLCGHVPGVETPG